MGGIGAPGGESGTRTRRTRADGAEKGARKGKIRKKGYGTVLGRDGTGRSVDGTGLRGSVLVVDSRVALRKK